MLTHAEYAGPLRESPVAFKDHGRWSRRESLGAAVTVPVAALLTVDHPPSVTPVPVAATPGSVRRRDREHVRELALVGARRLRGAGLDARATVGPTGARRRADQVGLVRATGAEALSGVMRPAGGGGTPGVVDVADL